jgi:hypothetical protein
MEMTACSRCESNRVGPDYGGRDPDLCTDCYWDKNGATVKLIWGVDGKEQVEEVSGLAPTEVKYLQNMERTVVDGKYLIYVRIEHPGLHEIS